MKELKEHGPENIVMAIAGNKCDLSDIRYIHFWCGFDTAVAVPFPSLVTSPVVSLLCNNNNILLFTLTIYDYYCYMLF